MEMKPLLRAPARNALSVALAVALSAALVPSSAVAQTSDAASQPQAAAKTAEQAKPKADAASKADTDQAKTLGAVAVTGYRYSIEKSLEKKRDANAVVEVITAEDISKFPDKNVADALQRVPGVIITRDGGEGKSVSIRGLSSDLTLTELNGNYIASSETNDAPSRSFNYLLLPANMISNVEVFKSPEARIDEGGIGGTVILHTRRPLEMESNTGFVTLEGTRADTTNKNDPQVSGLYSWHSKDERFGVLLGAGYQKRTVRSMSASTESWRWWADDAWGAEGPTDVHGRPFANQDNIARWWGKGVYDQAGKHYSGYWVPQSVNFGVRKEERERKNAQLTLQFKPIDSVNITANYFRFDLTGNYVDNLNKIPEWGYSDNWENDQGKLLAPGGLSFDPSGTIVTGAQFHYPTGGCALMTNPVTGAARNEPCTMETPQMSGVYSREKTKSQTADIEVEWNGESTNAVFKAGHTWSAGGPSISFRMSAKPRRLVNGQWQQGNQVSDWNLGGTPTLTLSPDLQQNLMAGMAQIDTGSTDSSWNSTSVAQTYYQLDLTRFFMTDWLDSVQAGVKYREGSAHRSTGNTLWYCPGTTDRYQSCDNQAGVAQPGFFEPNALGNIAGGFNANVFPAINFPAYLDYLNNRFGGAVRRNEPNFVYNVGEDIWAGYMQANFKTERLRGNVGLRVVRTQQNTNTTDRVTSYLDYYPNDASGNPAHCPTGGVFQGITCTPGDFVYLPESQQRQENYVLNVGKKTYTDVLPSLNLVYNLSDDLLLRGAASKVIARTGYADLGALGDLQYYTQEYYHDRGQFGAPRPGWYGSGGNKDLKPFEATQYDIGIEWYFHPGSVLGAGLFQKNVKNFIVPVAMDKAMEIGGEKVTVQNYSTQANGRDGTSKGVELYAQHTLESGLGFQANYTYNKTNLAAVVLDGEEIGKSPLVGSAKSQANLSAFYETGKFLVRASYNWRGTVVGGIVSGLNVYNEPYDQLDLNASYNITENLTWSGSVLNLTKSEQRSHLGNDTKARFYSNTYSGRQLYTGLTYKF